MQYLKAVVPGQIKKCAVSSALHFTQQASQILQPLALVLWLQITPHQAAAKMFWSRACTSPMCHHIYICLLCFASWLAGCGALPAARAGLTPQSRGNIACVVLWQAAIINNTRGKHPQNAPVTACLVWSFVVSFLLGPSMLSPWIWDYASLTSIV